MTNKNIFSIPVTNKRQISMRRRFILFSLILFLFILISGSITFVLLMDQALHINAGSELSKIVELERLRLEASVNAEIAIVLKMADSPLIMRYFTQPGIPELQRLAFEEMAAYSRAITGNYIFWVNDKDKIFYTINNEPYKVDPDNPENYWYNMTLYETKLYNFNINHNPNLNVTNLWINAPVYNSDMVPLGIVGTGINLSDFVNKTYVNYSEANDFYFFNAAGEITGAKNIDLVTNKTGIKEAMGVIGEEIIAKIDKLNNKEILLFSTKHTAGITAVCAIPALNWYMASVDIFTTGEALQTGVTYLFAGMMLLIFAIVFIVDIFVVKLLEPLSNIVKQITQIYSDWDLSDQEAIDKNEIETLGEFLTMTILDPLTGIYNRRFLDGNLKKIIKSHSRTNGKLSILMIDIDFFKKYNDTYGHDQGDNCLKNIAEVLSKTIIREEDFTARYGGEEFVVVLPNTDEKGALLIANKLLTKVRELKIPHETNTITGFVTISIGGTTGTVKYSHIDSEYIKCADIALYKSKNNGRNKYTFEPFKTDDELDVYKVKIC
ncbi:MAG: diguanylate cyclase [Treponema sp.]|nr:diguanylate cyclase [Treponema sp.]